MNKDWLHSLAQKLDRVMFQYDPYCYRESELSEEFFEYALQKEPEKIIDSLLDTIEVLMMSCTNYAEELAQYDGRFTD